MRYLLLTLIFLATAAQAQDLTEHEDVVVDGLVFGLFDLGEDSDAIDADASQRGQQSVLQVIADDLLLVGRLDRILAEFVVFLALACVRRRGHLGRADLRGDAGSHDGGSRERSGEKLTTIGGVSHREVHFVGSERAGFLLEVSVGLRLAS